MFKSGDGIKLNRRWLQFSLTSLLILATLVCLYLGWRVHVTEEDKALSKVRSMLDGVYFAWQQPELKKMEPARPEYTTTERLPDGSMQSQVKYRDSPYLLTEGSNVQPPEPDWFESWTGRTPRSHVAGVELPSYNVNHDVLTQLKKMPKLKYILVRGIYESSEGPTPVVLREVRQALPRTTVVGQIWKRHPKNLD